MPESLLSSNAVSRETIDQLKTYDALLHKWQKAINLVSPTTLQDSWVRHIEDSAQIIPYIPETIKHFVDCGVGAGFPGLVVAIMRPDLKITLIESDLRKCEFLKSVIRSNQLNNVTVINDRIENVSGLDTEKALMSARALASLDKLLGYAQHLGLREALFMKGQNLRAEIDEALKIYNFDFVCHQSQTEQGAEILHIKNYHIC